MSSKDRVYRIGGGLLDTRARVSALHVDLEIDGKEILTGSQVRKQLIQHRVAGENRVVTDLIQEYTTGRVTRVRHLHQPPQAENP